MPEQVGNRTPIDPQSIAAPLSSAAIFLVLGVNDGDHALSTARDVLGGLDDLIKTVSFREPSGDLSCIAGIGSDLWDRLRLKDKPAELKPFTAIQGKPHLAPATPGDILLHIRANRVDLAFELERIVLLKLAETVTVIDEVSGFRYFDARDLLGFVDGTANPVGLAIGESAIVGDEDPAFIGGSYVVVQRYQHDLTAWGKTSTAVQEEIIGRTKFDNIELPDDFTPRKSHKTLTTVVDDNGVEHDILRDNMPFGRPGQGEFGTYFIGYTRRLWVLEKMLERMFIGDPEGQYDRILDFSIAKTGSTFFCPPRPMLADLAN